MNNPLPFRLYPKHGGEPERYIVLDVCAKTHTCVCLDERNVLHIIPFTAGRFECLLNFQIVHRSQLHLIPGTELPKSKVS